MKKRTYPRPCTKCGKVFPEDGFYVKYNDTGARFSQCKECHNAHTRAALAEEFATDPEAYRAKRRARRAAKPEQYRAYKRQYYAEHAEHERERQRTWREQRREELRARERADYPRHRERKLRYRAERHGHYLALGAERRERLREQLRAQGRTYYQRNRDRFRAAFHLRRARERNAPGRFTAAEFAALTAKYGERCLCCGATGVLLTPDHIVPLARGGSNDIGNIQPLCRRCNTAKNAKSIDYRPPEDR